MYIQSLLFTPPRYTRGQFVSVMINHTWSPAKVVSRNDMGVLVEPCDHPTSRVMIHYPWNITELKTQNFLYS